MTNGNGGFFHNLATSAEVGFFLAFRQVRRSNFWTTALIIAVMTLTFLNLVVVSGILVGLIEGSVSAVRGRYTSDVIVSNLTEKSYIENSRAIIESAKALPWVEGVTARYVETGTIEANYKTKIRETDLSDEAGTAFAGIDPVAEDAITHLSDRVILGEYLEPGDYDKVLVGALLLKQYLDFEAPGFSTLDNVEIGTKVRINVNGTVREVTVKGITKSKVDEIDRRVFFIDSQFRSLIGRNDFNVDEIAIKLKPGADPVAVKDALLSNGFGAFAKIQTFEDAQPKFLKDIKQTFAILGSVISSIGLAVASITIFIVIFVNAITRRKFIGILKGIGIHRKAIEFAYVLQALFYAFIGTAIGLIILFGLLKPYIAAHPINFPFSDGILVATPVGTAVRVAVLFIATLIAGYIPARIVVKQNTLDAILGR